MVGSGTITGTKVNPPRKFVWPIGSPMSARMFGSDAKMLPLLVWIVPAPRSSTGYLRIASGSVL